MLVLPSCYLLRIIKWQGTDMHDYKKFQYNKIENDRIVFRFNEGRHIKSSDIKLPQAFNKFRDFEELINKTKTLSFLIVKNDSVIFEKYYSGTNDSSVYPSFSVSKSFVSALIGIAIDEGYIKSVDQPITVYLSELKDKNFNKVTIEHLLNMKTGIAFSENYSNPFSDIAKYYYGTNLKGYIRNLRVKEEPGKKYDYVSVSTLLLTRIIEKATGRKISEYLQEKIWKPLGMEFDATWSIDSKKHEVVKAFCCLNARTRDYAKFGRLYLNDGIWNGKQIISKKWVNKSIIYSPDSASAFYYNYQWRVGNKGDYFAKGAKGQFIYVYPSKKIVIVRTGEDYGIDNWQEVFRNICEQL